MQTSLHDLKWNQSYVPMWFEIKCQPSIKDASKNLWKSISLSAYLKEDLAKCIQKVIQNNAYFAHPENLLAMLCDEKQKIRKLAVSRMISARKSTGKSILRKFEVPLLNSDEKKDYTELID